MDKLIYENEKKIERFDLNYYLNCKNYQMAAAISALDTTNEIQKSYFKPETGLESCDYVLRLYALLQGLFVSIDSLYALAYALTKSKNFININNNKDLRELKYIRNDVVGHPSNRVLNKDILAYCMLDNKSITKERFTYYIYAKDEIRKKEIIIRDILVSYYKESNDLLDELYKIAVNGMNHNDLELLITKTLDVYFNNGNYLSYFNQFISRYKKNYPSASKNQHRILWRYDLIMKLNRLVWETKEEQEVIHYCIGLELAKIYELTFRAKYKVEMQMKLPAYISSFYRFMNKNKDLYICLNYVKDTTHPLFKTALERLRKAAAAKEIEDTVKYLDLIIAKYDCNELDLVYALALPIQEYKRKS